MSTPLFDVGDIIILSKNPSGTDPKENLKGLLLIVTEVITELKEDELGEDKVQPDDLPYYLCRNRWYEFYIAENEAAPIVDEEIMGKIAKYSMKNDCSPIWLKDLQ